MGAATQLEAVVLDSDGPDRLAVLFVEEGVSTSLDRLGHAHERDGDAAVLPDDAVDLVLDGALLVVAERAVEREVETEVVGRHERACLTCPLPDDVPERTMEQVRRRVIAHRVRPPFRIHDRVQCLPDPEPSVEGAAQDDQPADGLLGVHDREEFAPATRFAQDAVIPDLATTLGVERGSIQDDLRIAVTGQLVELHPVTEDRHDLALGGGHLVAEERRVPGPTVDGAVERHQLGVLRELGLRAGSAAVALFGESSLEAVALDLDAVLGGELDGQVDREPVRVMELERHRTGKSRRAGGQILRPPADHPWLCVARHEPGDLCFEQLRAGVECPGELRLLAGDDAQDLVAPRNEVRVGLTHDLDDDRGGLGHERFPPSEKSSVTDRPAEELPEHVSAALVRGQDVVGDEEGHRPGMIGDHLIAEPFGLEGVGIVPEEVAHPGVDRREQVRVVVGRDLLEDAGQAFQPQPGIHARKRQRHPAIRPLVELHEHEVPDLQPARAMLAMVGDAVRPLGQVRAAVEMDLAARAARAGLRHPPEVVVVAVVHIAPARHPLRREADLVAPDVPCDIVVLVGRRREPVRGDAEFLRQQVPREMDRLALEVVAERPVAEHLEERVMARGAPDLFEVVVLAGHAQAALVVHGPCVRPGFRADQDVLELDHPGVREQERRVAGRHEAGAGHGGVTALGEEFDEPAADLGGGQRHDPGIWTLDGRRHRTQW